jgi:inhibitor of cysteine peptidase
MRQFNEEANATETDIPIGEVFEICLKENPTAGFRWDLDSGGAPACLLVSEHFSHRGEAPGSQGIRYWKFKVVAPGKSTIGLSYRRYWEEKPPAQTFRLEIRTDE